ncbi:MAG: acetyl-CoA carboxylase carboxyltransferase subunit alpha [Alphaproteobacteria bacterium]|nr:acetyl-CoA carboxylase carboxyltransferase subunit alpha [Alphaproteobacteria bacterium]
MEEFNDYLDFEKPIAELESKMEAIRRLSDENQGLNIASEVSKLEAKLTKEIEKIYTRLTPWQVVQVARHVKRPHSLDYINALFEGFIEFSGDRQFGDDKAVIGGLARFNGQPVVVIGQEKGHDLETRIRHNFGSAFPEGYRKAIRLMDMADRFGLPIITFVDTAGAYPDVEAEERGQAEAIARAIQRSTTLAVPFIACVIGEGGSGGAIAIATANRVLMMQNAVYSVISPEGCAGIVWRVADDDTKRKAAESMKVTAGDLKKLGVIDEIIPEPLGGAHRDPQAAIKAAGETIQRHLKSLEQLSPHALRESRKERFLNIRP